MDLCLSYVVSCPTYNISNHFLKEKTTNLTSNIWSALYNMIPRTRKQQYIVMGEDGFPYVHLPEKLLAQCVHCSLSSVKRAISQLKDLGLIMIKRIRSRASTRNFYRIPLDHLNPNMPSTPCENAPEPERHRAQNDTVHTGNYILDTKEKSSFSSEADPTIEEPYQPRELTSEEQTAIQGSWTDYFLSQIPPKPEMPFRRPRAGSKERSRVQVPIPTGERGCRSVGSILGQIKGIALDILPKLSSQDPLALKKRSIDRSTLAGDIKKIHKRLIDTMGTDGLRFITSYVDTGKIKIEYNPVKNDHMAVIEDDDTRNYIQMKYNDVFNVIGLRITS